MLCQQTIEIVPGKVTTYCTKPRGHDGNCGPKAIVDEKAGTVTLMAKQYKVPKKSEQPNLGHPDF